jgi:hypothetical protein
LGRLFPRPFLRLFQISVPGWQIIASYWLSVIVPISNKEQPVRLAVGPEQADPELEVVKAAQMIPLYPLLSVGAEALIESKVTVRVWPEFSTLFDSELEVWDLSRERERLRAAGIAATEIKTVPKVISFFDVKDPDGNGMRWFQVLASDPKVTGGRA